MREDSLPYGAIPHRALYSPGIWPFFPGKNVGYAAPDDMTIS